MKLRIQEIEFSSRNPRKTKDFYDYILNTEAVVQEDRLKVLNTGSMSLDFKVNPEFPTKITGLIMATADLGGMMRKLQRIEVPFQIRENSDKEGVYIEFDDPDGARIQVHEQQHI